MSKLLQNKGYLAGDLKIIYAFSCLNDPKYRLTNLRNKTFMIHGRILTPFHPACSIMDENDIKEIMFLILNNKKYERYE